MRIAFVLPGSARKPIGGFKVVYEYANHLVRNGHEVYVVQPRSIETPATASLRLRHKAGYWVRRISGSHSPAGWFALDESVGLRWRPTLDARYVPDADVVVATSWRTAEIVAQYPKSKGDKWYLIQHLETWSGEEERVMRTWRLPLRKIVIATWLKDIATDLGEAATVVPNGMDFQSLGMDETPESRSGRRLMMLHHTLSWKGTADGLEAVARLRDAGRDVSMTLFGTEAPEGRLPNWVEFHRRPGPALLRRLYNQAGVFVAPSWTEGWGLPASEAMACGAALVATNVGGHREFAIEGRTALLAPPRDPVALAERIARLVDDNELRVRLARAGAEYVRRFTWEAATSRLEKCLSKPRHAPPEPDVALRGVP